MSTTGRSASEYIEQPEGSYILPKPFEVKSLGEGGDALNLEENVSLDLVASAVGYMTGVMSGELTESVFRFPLFVARRIGGDAFAVEAQHLIDDINGLDDGSIINALKLSGFGDRFLVDPENYQPLEEINPDEVTIQNVRTMVERLLRFFYAYDVKSPMSDTLWALNVSKSHPTEAQTLQLLIGWRKRLRSPLTWWHDFKYLGIYNSRLNKMYRISVDAIPEDLINEIDRDVLGYSE
jgi:hypothetical protein